MKNRTFFGGVLFFLIALSIYWLWIEFAPNFRQETELRLSLDDKIESLDPAKAFSDDSLLVSAQVIEPLFQYHYLKRPYEIEPLVAEGGLQTSKDGKIVKISLKKNIFYHEHEAFGGKRRELVADDYVLQFKRLALKSLKSPGRSLFSGLVEGFDEYGEIVEEDWKKIQSISLPGVESEGKYSLVIRLIRPEPNLVYYLALNFTAPVPYELFEYYKNDLNKTLLGTGPFILSDLSSNHIVLKRNSEYREEFYPTSGDRYANVEKLLDSKKQLIPFLDRVSFNITVNEEDRWNKFLKKEIDVLTVPKTFLPKVYDKSGELAPELQERRVLLKQFPTLANRWLAFNMRIPLFADNIHLRKAIAYAIDYDAYIKVLSQNTNLRANSILVPGISGYRPTKDFRFHFDPVLARKHLKLAGFEDTSKIPVIIYSTRGNQAIHLVEAAFIKSQLESLGLRVSIEILSFAEFLTKGREGKLMFFTDNWLFDYPDGENILQLLVSANYPGINKSGYSNDKIDNLYEVLKKTTNLDMREQIIQQMEGIIFNEAPWIPLMYESSFVIHYPEIKNYRKSSIIRNYVKYLKVEN
jgi:oligopeptide transport system substrate-binding protein